MEQGEIPYESVTVMPSGKAKSDTRQFDGILPKPEVRISSGLAVYAGFLCAYPPGRVHFYFVFLPAPLGRRGENNRFLLHLITGSI